MIPRSELRSHVRRSERTRAAARISAQIAMLRGSGVRSSLLVFAVAEANGPTSADALGRVAGVSTRTAARLLDVLVDAELLTRGDYVGPAGTRRTHETRYDLPASSLDVVAVQVARLGPDERVDAGRPVVFGSIR